LLFLIGAPGILWGNTVYTFTDAGASGREGPTQTQVNTAYAGGTLANSVTINTRGIQEWTVPAGGLYRIEAYGAKGGSNTENHGGNGAKIIGEFTLQSGEAIKILIGQRGQTLSIRANTGGGGGTFVWKLVGNTLMLAAGGGGGAGYSYVGKAAVATANGTTGSNNGGNPGSSGQGGNPGAAGWLSNGTGTNNAGGGNRPLAGGVGGVAGTTATGYGGFGGGSGGTGGNQTMYGAGGGSGYSGGAAQTGNDQSGGGGGSFNSGANQATAGGAHAGAGRVIITLLQVAPVISQGAGPLSKTISEDATASWTSAELSATDADTAASSLTWSVSSQASNGTATVTGSGASPASFTYAPNANFNGSDSFVVRVSDGSMSDTITVNVTVNAVNDAPVISQGAGPLSKTISEDGTASWTSAELSASDADTVASSLIWSVSSSASNGTATVTGSGASPATFTYAPNANFNGSDSFVVRVSDGSSTDTITMNVTVNAMNDAPVISQGAGPLSKTISEDGTASWTSAELSATDADTAASSLTWSVSSQASNGTATVTGSGASPSTFTYVPNLNFNGSDSFVVRVSDGSLTDSITVNITVNAMNDAPVISQGAGPLSKTVSEDGTATWTSAELSATDADTAASSLTWSVSSQASNGTATVTGSGASPAAFTYAPNANFNGSDSFVVRVSDGSLSDTITVNVTVSDVNDAPVITQGASLTIVVAEDATLSSSGVAATDSDAGDVLTWSFSAQGDLKGSLSLGGTGASPTFLYQPQADFHGSVNLLARVTDSAGAYDETTITISVTAVEDFPEITYGGGGATASASSSENLRSVVFVTASDADGDSFSHSIASGADASLFSMDSATGELSFVSAPNFESPTDSNSDGIYEVTVRVTDTNGNSDDQAISVTVLDAPESPSDLALLPFSIPENQPTNTLVGSFSTVDPDDPNSTGSYQYALVDGNGSSDNAAFLIDANGSLRALSSFDFESLAADANRSTATHGEVSSSLTSAGYPSTLHLAAQTSYPLLSIRIRTTDDTNASFEKAVSIAVLDRDDEIPVITSNGDSSVRHPVWRTYQDAGAIALDNLDGNLTSSIVSVNPVDSNQPGDYVLTYDLVDAAGNSAQRVTRTVTVYNTDPSDVVLSNGIIDENQPSGTFAGRFSTVDPDDQDGTKTYLYTLVEGNGSADNASFTLQSDGTLRSAASFDFESKNSYDLRVRSTDEFGGFREEAFVIRVRDCFVPVVETLGVSEIQASSAKFEGRIDDPGGLTVLEKGFVVGSRSLPVLGGAGVSVTPGQVSATGSEFSGLANSLSSTQVHYVRAYAVNSEGTAYGLEQSFVTTGWGNKPTWTEADAGSTKDWWTSPWFGNFFQSSNGWIMHEKMGWVFPVQSQTSGVWLWKKGEGWLWTDSGLYPRLYGPSYESWLYFYGVWKGQKLFYFYDEQRWIISEEQ